MGRRYLRFDSVPFADYTGCQDHETGERRRAHTVLNRDGRWEIS